jgi:hypothetical protein
MQEPKRRTPFRLDLPVLVVMATILVGVFSLLYMGEAPRESKPICLVAAASAFGLASIAIWRR